MAIYNSYSNHYYPSYRASSKTNDTDNVTQIVTKPIDTVENIVNSTVDSFIPESVDEETKKSHKNAIRVGSTVLVLSAFVALLNPKFSSKLISKMKASAEKYQNKAKNSNSVMGKFYKFMEKFQSEGSKILDFSNNINSVKDDFFKQLCSKTKGSKKCHDAITNAFDKLGKQTVYKKYTSALKSLDTLDATILKHKSKLSAEEQKQVEILFEQIKKQREYFGKSKITERLKTQEDLMSELQDNITEHTKGYFKGIGDNIKKPGELKKHLNDNMYFWAERMLAKTKNDLMSKGGSTVDDLISARDTISLSGKSSYTKIANILSPYLNHEEKTVIDNLMTKAAKRLTNANKCECISYFDKKRDLVLGSAPTDIVSGLFLLGIAGTAIGRADDNQEKISKALTKAFPAFAGIGVNLAMASLLYSGIVGMGVGSASGWILSLLGSKIDKTFVSKNNKPQKNNSNQKAETFIA